jgi:hypothetical protein
MNVKTEIKIFLTFDAIVSFFIIFSMTGCNVNNEYTGKMQAKINALQLVISNNPMRNKITEEVSSNQDAIYINTITSFSYCDACMSYKKLHYQARSIMK